VEVMYHAHWPKHIDGEHLFHLPDVRVGRCHGIAYQGDMSLVKQNRRAGKVRTDSTVRGSIVSVLGVSCIELAAEDYLRIVD
jgi:hypothetical protein